MNGCGVTAAAIHHPISTKPDNRHTMGATGQCDPDHTAAMPCSWHTPLLWRNACIR